MNTKDNEMTLRAGRLFDGPKERLPDMGRAA